MPTINYINMDNYIIHPELEIALKSGILPDKTTQKIDKNKRGVYLVMFRVLNNNEKTLVYNYIYYPTLFTICLLYYIGSIRSINNVKQAIQSEGGNNLIVIDDLFNIYKEGRFSLNNRNIYLDFLYNNSVNIQPNLLVSFINRVNYISDISDMVELLYFAYTKDYTNFVKIILSSIPGYNMENVTYLKNSDWTDPISFMNSTLFMVHDLDKFKDNLRLKGFDVNEGPQKWRGQINSIIHDLDTFDTSFRNSLYHHHLYHARPRQKTIPGTLVMTKSNFSFNNIHMNLGTVRWYTSSILNTQNSLCNVRYLTTKKSSWESVNSNHRQQLFEENYTIISDILERNFNVGSSAVQREIEMSLYNQEKVFSEMEQGKDKFRLKFNEQGYNFLVSKKKELCNLLNFHEELQINTKLYSNKYLPLVKDIVSLLSIDVVSDLLLSYFLQILSKETDTLEDSEVEMPGIMTIKGFNDFGRKIFNRYLFYKYIRSDQYKKNRDTYSLSEYIESVKHEYTDIYEEDGSYAMMAGNFVWCLVTVNLLYQVLAKHPENDTETINFLRVTQECRDILHINKVRIQHLPPKLPMICEPKDWVYSTDKSKNKLGGYLLNDKYYTEKLIRDKIGYEKATTLKEGNLVLPMVTGIMKTPYKINVDTLDFIYKFGIQKKIVLDDTSPDIKNFISNPYKKYSHKKVSKKYRSIVSKITMERNIISIADVYSKIDKIYFPVKLDFRLRVYCDTDSFDYQKTDLAKGLISFANPGFISKTDKDAIKYFKAYGANMYGQGLDKKSLNYRVKWVEVNTDRIVHFQENDIVDNAENKTCFISFCFEYIKFIDFMNLKEELLFPTYLPIQLDASCNGYQHLALLTKETPIFSELNLMSSSHDHDPGDFYSYIKHLYKEYIKSEIERLSALEPKTKKDISRVDSLKKLSLIEFGRDVYKIIIMRGSYSAGTPRMGETILSLESMGEFGKGKTTYHLYKHYDVKLYLQDMMIFVNCIKSVVGAIAPKIKNLSRYLTRVVHICTLLGMPIPWNLPNGAEIKESYLIAEEKKIPAFTFTKSKYTFKKYLPGKYDIKAQKRAIRPNLIHSLDACVISELYASLKSDRVDLYTVHDCFAVTADNVQTLINKLQLVYIKLYSSNDYLTTFDAMLKININNTFGDKIYELNSNHIYLIDASKYKKVPFPDINEIIKLDKDKDKLEKVAFPDITQITSLNKNISLDQLKDAPYIAV